MTSPVRAPRPTPRRAPAPAPAPRTHLRVVPPPSRRHLRRRRTGAVLAVAAVLVFGSLMSAALFHGLLVGGQSNLDRLDTQLQDERAALARDKLELAKLQSPAHIAAQAEALGMVPADGQTWVSPGTGASPVVIGSDIDTSTDSTTETTVPSDASTSELATADGGAGTR